MASLPACRTVTRKLVASIVTAFLLAAAMVLGSGVQAAEPVSVESLKTSLDEVEAAIGREDIASDALAGLRPKLNAAADAIRAKIDELEPRVGDLEERIKQLGPPPAKDAPPKHRKSPMIANSSRRISAKSTAR